MNTPTVASLSDAPLVTRSSVSSGLPYKDYKEALRWDFFFQCAYCTMSEAEANSIRFTIDHYTPQAENAALINDYSNLMWCCDTCNTFKGSRVQPSAATAEGHRFYRPDQDSFLENFVVKGQRIEGLTNVGRYTETFLTLNRAYLMRLRNLRSRLFEASEDVARGMRALRGISRDQLPKHLKGPVAKAIQEMINRESDITGKIDLALAENVRSYALDEDPEHEALLKARRAESERLRSLFPGVWRAQAKQVKAS